MDELVQFLRDRLDEDAAPRVVPAWHEAFCLAPTTDDPCFYCGATVDHTKVEHVPQSARVLRDIEAKRQLLRVAERAHDYHETFTSGFASALEGVLRLFAAAYAEHPGYREEWRP